MSRGVGEGDFWEDYWRFKASILLNSLASGWEAAALLGFWKARWSGHWECAWEAAVGPYSGDERYSLSGNRLGARRLEAGEVYRRLSRFSALKRGRGDVGGGDFYGNLYRGLFLAAMREFRGPELAAGSMIGDPASVAAAATAMSNLLVADALGRESGGADKGVGLRGYVVSFTLGSVQSFISRSRTVRDLFSASLVSSLLTWYAVKGLVEALGPDILVSPSPVDNPFIEFSLVSSMAKSPFGSDVLKEMYTSGYKVPYTYSGGTVSASLAFTVPSPSSAILVLPDSEVVSRALGVRLSGDAREQLASLLVDSYREGWRSMVRLAECCLPREHVEELTRVLEKIAESPPQPPRVRIARVEGECGGGGDAANSLVARVLLAIQGPGKISDEEVLREFEEYVSGVEVWSNIGSIVGQRWPGYSSLTSETEDEYRAGASRRLCSVCGLLPADVVDGDSSLPLALRREKILRRGERLCPYCLLRRIIGRIDCVEQLYSVALGLEKVHVEGDVATTSDLGAYGFRLLLEERLRIGVKGDELENEVEEYWKNVRKVYGSRIEEFPGVAPYVKSAFPMLYKASRRSEDWGFATLAAEEVFYNNSSPDLVARLAGAGEEEARRLASRLSDIRGKAAEGLRELRLERLAGPAPFNTYYVLLRSDVDGGGLFRRGVFPPTLETAIKRLKEESGGTPPRPYVPEGETGKRFRLAPVVLVHYSSLMNSMARRYRRIAERYGGWTVFSSGDDLLMFLPASRALEAAIAVRDDMRRGELRFFTRSVALLAAHYRAPMYVAVSEATRILEEEAKGFTVAGEDGEPVYVKDAISVGIVARGSLAAEAAVLPLSGLGDGERLTHVPERPNPLVGLLGILYEELVEAAARGRSLLSVNVMHDYFTRYAKYAPDSEDAPQILSILILRNLRSSRSDAATAVKRILGVGSNDDGPGKKLPPAALKARAYVNERKVVVLDELFKALRYLFIASRGGA